MTSTEIIRRASVEEICGHRARTLELYARAYAAIEEAHKAHRLAAPGVTSLHTFGVSGASRRGYGFASLEEIRKDVDRDVWRSVIVSLGLVTLMDRQEREAWEKQVEENPPEATAENITATCFRLLGESDLIFRRGLVNAFARFCRDYASNDGFKIGPRIVVNYAWSRYSNGRGGFYLSTLQKDAELRDLDRVMHVLDGQAPPESYNAGLLGAIREANAGKVMTAETPYWRARWFLNGNLHLFPLRDDLLTRANRLIADHYGDALACPA
jgi:hypothetical protein